MIHNGRQPDDLLGDESAADRLLAADQPARLSATCTAASSVGFEESAEAGKPWVVACDEPGDASHALITDDEDPAHDDARMNGLWGCLLGGGAGNEWYFGYKHPHSDLTCQDWRSRDLWWDQCRIALEFFQTHLPFTEMESAGFVDEGRSAILLCQAGRDLRRAAAPAEDSATRSAEPRRLVSSAVVQPASGWTAATGLRRLGHWSRPAIAGRSARRTRQGLDRAGHQARALSRSLWSAARSCLGARPLRRALAG